MVEDGLSQWASTHPVMLVNEVMPPDRIRLTLAHGLGHLVLHGRHIDADMEDQANALAAESLMREHVNARGWKRNEPASDRLPVEAPELAQSTGERLRASGLSEGDIAQIVGVDPDRRPSWFVPADRQLRVV